MCWMLLATAIFLSTILFAVMVILLIFSTSSLARDLSQLILFANSTPYFSAELPNSSCFLFMIDWPILYENSIHYVLLVLLITFHGSIYSFTTRVSPILLLNHLYLQRANILRLIFQIIAIWRKKLITTIHFVHSINSRSPNFLSHPIYSTSDCSALSISLI
jgi:hypothetical protein